jgi:hypothetical protein
MEDEVKKILAISLVSLAALTGCLSPAEQLCLDSATCAGEKDPAAFCQDAKEEEASKCALEKCKAEADASAACTLANGECKDEVFTVDPADACETESTALGECFLENCA